MYQALVQLHSVGRWIVLLLLIVAIFRSATAGNRPYVKSDNTLGLVLTSFSDLMLLIGIYLWFAGGIGYQPIKDNGMATVMANPVYRFFTTQHMVGMLVAIALIHIGKAQGKKSIPDKTKHRRAFILYLIALLIILACIPWPFMQAGANRGWI